MEKNLSMQDWVFREALGNYDIDLGDSNAPCLTAEALQGSLTHTLLDYGTDRGTLALRKLVAERYDLDVASVGITHGAQEALYLVYRTLLSPGDHIITFSPGWKQAWQVPKDIGCTVEILEYNQDLKVTASTISKALRQNTKAIILNNPCNPTGKKIPRQELQKIITIAESRDLYLIVDEEYLADPNESMALQTEKAIICSSLSKIYGAPGLRVGWLCANPEIIDSTMQYKHYTTISNSTLCERLAIQILKDCDQRTKAYKELCHNGYEVLDNWARSCFPMVELVRPEGTPFCWAHLTTSESSLSFCRRVLEHERILTMPAELFGKTHGMRITFARPREELIAGLSKIKNQFRFPISMY